MRPAGCASSRRATSVAGAWSGRPSSTPARHSRSSRSAPARKRSTATSTTPTSARRCCRSWGNDSGCAVATVARLRRRGRVTARPSNCATMTERAYVAALRILGDRFNSELELRRKLQRKKFDEAIIDATIARLRDEKWLDDERFAGAFARTRSRKRIGGKRIVLELRAAGVDDDVATRAVKE